MSYDFNIKSSEVLKNATEKIKKRLEKDLQKVVKTLGKGGANHAKTLAKSRLSGNLSDMYASNVYMEQISDNMVVIGLNPEAAWIENGTKGGFMDYLLKGPKAKTAKDGSKYNIIPFKHETGKKTKGATSSGSDLVSELKGFLRSKGVAHSRTRALALDSNGSPRIGKIHSFDIKDMRGKGKKSVNKLSRNLQGVSVFQNMNEKTGKVERNIMTFRVISSKHEGSGKWMRKGKKGERILAETHKWIQDTWQNELLPALKNKYESK